MTRIDPVRCPRCKSTSVFNTDIANECDDCGHVVPKGNFKLKGPRKPWRPKSRGTDPRGVYGTDDSE